MSPPSTETVAELIAGRLAAERADLQRAWAGGDPVRHFVVDDLLPGALLDAAVADFPAPARMQRLASIREHKRTSQRAADWGASCSTVMLALQHPAVLAELTAVTGIADLRADPDFWASGLSRMDRDDFLNPHLDNSGHANFRGYRRLNALLYASRGWQPEFGGNLELWTDGLRSRREIASLFNRLVVMNTDRRSWHSVNRVAVDRPRLCLSNYYYTSASPEADDYSHITSFRGRPGQWLRDAYLRAESTLGTLLVRAFPRNPNRS